MHNTLKKLKLITRGIKQINNVESLFIIIIMKFFICLLLYNIFLNYKISDK